MTKWADPSTDHIPRGSQSPLSLLFAAGTHRWYLHPPSPTGRVDVTGTVREGKSVSFLAITGTKTVQLNTHVHCTVSLTPAHNTPPHLCSVGCSGVARSFQGEEALFRISNKLLFCNLPLTKFTKEYSKLTLSDRKTRFHLKMNKYLNCY